MKTLSVFSATVLLAAGSIAAVPLSAQTLQAAATVQAMDSTGYGGDPTVIWVPELGERGKYIGARTDNAGYRGDTASSVGSGMKQNIQLWSSVQLEDLFTSPSVKIPTDTNYCDGAEAPGLVEFTDPADGKPYVWLSFRGNGLSYNVVRAPAAGALVAANWQPAPTIAGQGLTGTRDWSFLVTTSAPDGIAPDPRTGECPATPGPTSSDGTKKTDLWAFFPDSRQTAPQGDGLYVQHMLTPAIKDRCRPEVLISTGANTLGSDESRPWEERHNTGKPGDSSVAGSGTNEAPQAFIYQKNQTSKPQVYVTYSANSYQFGDYLLGLLSFSGNLDDLDGARSIAPGQAYTKWSKSQKPFFQATNYPDSGTAAAGTFFPVCNVGSAAIVATNQNAPNPYPTELWMFYNGKSNCTAVTYSHQLQPSDDPPNPSPTGCSVGTPPQQVDQTLNGVGSGDTVLYSGNARTIRLQKIAFDTNGAIQFSNPKASTAQFTAPTGEQNLPADYLADADGTTYDDGAGRIATATGNQLPNDSLTNQIYYSADFHTDAGAADAAYPAGTSPASKTLTQSFAAGSSVQIAFFGTGITIYGPRGNCHGAGCAPNDSCVAPTYGKVAITQNPTVYDPLNIPAKDLQDLSKPASDPSQPYVFQRNFGSPAAQHVVTLTIPPATPNGMPEDPAGPYSMKVPNCNPPKNQDNSQAPPVLPFAVDKVVISNN